MSTTTSSIIGALGGGSGVDMVKLAGDLAVARFAPQVGQLESRSEALEARISAASTLRNQITQLAAALGDRIRNGDLSPAPAIGNGAVARVSALAGSAGSGSHSLEVTSLASAQVLGSPAYGSADALVGEGELSIRFGTVSGTDFSEDTGRPAVTIALSASDTLADLAARISASGSGLSAYVAQGITGAQLVVKGADGAANAFVIEATGPSVSGAPVPGALDYLDWNPVSDAGQRTASARDAQFLFDGVAMSSASNRVTGLPGGLSLILASTNTGAPTTITFADKTREIGSFMGDFVAALNDITATLAELAAPQGGELGNDPGARALKRALAGLAGEIVMPGAAPGEPRTLADLGLRFTREGSFALDSTRLQATLADRAEGASAMFTTGLFGVFATVDRLARQAGSRSDPGSLGGSVSRYTSQLEQLDQRLERVTEQQERLREQLVKDFTWADRNVAASRSTLSFLQSQIAIWTAQDR